MIRRFLAALLLVWLLGFVLFAVALPKPAPDERTDAIVVLTGSGGRIERGLALLQQRQAPRLLVTGVAEQVRPGEFAAEYDVPPATMRCCVTLGFAALDTRGNGLETAQWVKEQQVRTLRLVTTDWHMRRGALELEAALPPDVVVVRDAIRSEPSLFILLLEYHKLLAAWVMVRVVRGA
ncbi:YdcF family protein [Croceibacterium sp. TMG7-5b_MA50]|uniref:YdcF family protein n=1 Tax=Croceibacterium sp. TMG7-5b_MA50 TaxID=3121290 RepID=UPI003221AA67